MSDNNIFDRVDGVESKVNDVSAKMDSLTAKIDGLLSVKQTTTTTHQTENPQVVLKRFISKAKKEYCWLGSEADFQKEKKTALILLATLIGAIIFSTVFTSIALGLYSMFTLFENIWLIMMCFVAFYLVKAKRFYDCYEFSLTSCFKFEPDADGVLRMGAPNKKYKVFLVLTCISAICNIIVVWMENKNGMALPATIFELAVFGLSIFVFNFKALNFFYGYSNLRFTGANEATGKKVVLIYEPIMNKLYSEEDYLKQFPFCK
jgi:hypothetical protein